MIKTFVCVDPVIPKQGKNICANDTLSYLPCKGLIEKIIIKVLLTTMETP